MPYPNEHAARLRPPSGFVRFRRKNDAFGPGIHAIYGVTREGKAVLQSLRFDASRFTADEARRWLREHDYKPVEFAPASKEAAMQFAVWTRKYINDLPDSAFLYIEPGGKKDEEGKTTPRSLRHFPYKDASGKVDLPHLRNALARIPQSNLPQDVKERVTAKARKILERAKERAGLAILSPDSSDFEAASSPAEREGFQVQKFRKELIREGTYTHPVHQWTLNVDEDRMRRWVATFREMSAAGVHVPVNVDHNHSAKAVVGWVTDMFIENGRLIGILEMRGDEAISLARRNRSVSIEVAKNVKDGKGNTWEEAIVGCAVVWDPVVPAQTGFVPVAASLGSARTRMAPLYVMAKETMMDEKLKAELVNVLGDSADVDTAEAAVQALMERVKQLQTEIRSLQDQAEAAKKKAASRTGAPDTSDVDPDAAEMLAEATEAKLDTLVAAGNITPAVRDKLAEVLVGKPGQRNLYCLSRKVSGEATPLARQVIDILSENRPQELRTLTGVQALSRNVPGDGDDSVDPDIQKEMVMMAMGGVAEAEKDKQG